MAVVAEKKGSGGESQWSVRRKTDAVMRLLRCEDLDTVARELRVEAHRLAAWRDEFMAGGGARPEAVVTLRRHGSLSWIPAGIAQA